MRTEIEVLVYVVGAAVLSMFAFAAGPARRALDQLESDVRGKLLLGSFARRWFYWAVRPIERLSLAVGLTPLFYNFAGVGFGIAAGILFVNGRFALAGWAVLLSGVADALDGRVARARGVASARGAFIDSTLDRFAEVAVFVGLAAAYRDSVFGAVATAAALGGSLLVSYARARGESQGVLCTAGIMQRAERLLLVGFGGILDGWGSDILAQSQGALLKWVLLLAAAGTIGTAVYRTVWISRRLEG